MCGRWEGKEIYSKQFIYSWDSKRASPIYGFCLNVASWNVYTTELQFHNLVPTYPFAILSSLASITTEFIRVFTKAVKSGLQITLAGGKEGRKSTVVLYQKS